MRVLLRLLLVALTTAAFLGGASTVAANEGAIQIHFEYCDTWDHYEVCTTGDSVINNVFTPSGRWVQHFSSYIEVIATDLDSGEAVGYEAYRQSGHYAEVDGQPFGYANIQISTQPNGDGTYSCYVSQSVGTRFFVPVTEHFVTSDCTVRILAML